MRVIRQLLTALLGLGILATAALGMAVPASAHDAAESTSPAAGEAVAAPPERVSITLNRAPLELGAQVLVNDAAGTNWADGPVEMVGNVAAQKLKAGAPAGAYTVLWRVVSSDSHPIEGTFSFTAAAGTTATGTTAAAAVPTMGTAQPGTTQAPAPTVSAAEPFPWSIVIFVATATGIIVVLVLMAKSRLADRDQPGPENGTGNEGS